MKRSRWTTPAAGVVSGILFALAFPPFGWTILLPLALVPWLVALVREEGRWRALLSGLLFGLAYWCLSISWITFVVTHFGGQSGAMGAVCLVLLAAILAEWPAAAAFAAVACAPAGSARRLAVFPVLWMASEHLRSFVYGGFPWNLTGNALFRRPVWLQTASVGGVYLVGGLLSAVSCLLAAAVVFRRARPLLGAAGLVLAAGAFGAARLGERPGPPPALSVALLQPNVSQESRLAGSAAESYERVMGMAREASAGKPNLVVIPESAFPIYWDRSPRLRQDLTAVAAASRGLVLFNDVEELPDGRYFNVARLLGPDGLVGAPYRKVHRVPFGEYVPLPKLFFFVRQVSTEIGEFSAAEVPTTLQIPGGRIGVGICYEILYAGLVREEVGRLAANLLVTISNDSWYGRAGAQEQHFAGAVLRAVETRRYLLRAAITGISGIVDEKGRIVGELARDTPGVLRGAARLDSAGTIWTRGGYWLPRLADVAAAAVLLFGLARFARGRPKNLS